MKITEYPKVETLDSKDVLLVDGANGTKIIEAGNLTNAITKIDGTVNGEYLGILHRNTFRGKNLGNTFTSEQKAAIRNGSFDDLYVGDFWKDSSTSITWRIADINYWLNCGEYTESGENIFNKQHIVVVPDEALSYNGMNTSIDTTGGYVGSDMYKQHLQYAKERFIDFFGSDSVLSHKEYYINEVTNGYPSRGAWYNTSVCLMNEPMVYGAYMYTPGGNGVLIPNRYTIDKTQLSLFRIHPYYIHPNSENYWLRDVVSADRFAAVGDGGVACSDTANSNYGVRPIAAIG